MFMVKKLQQLFTNPVNGKFYYNQKEVYGSCQVEINKNQLLISGTPSSNTILDLDTNDDEYEASFLISQVLDFKFGDDWIEFADIENQGSYWKIVSNQLKEIQEQIIMICFTETYGKFDESKAQDYISQFYSARPKGIIKPEELGTPMKTKKLGIDPLMSAKSMISKNGNPKGTILFDTKGQLFYFDAGTNSFQQAVDEVIVQIFETQKFQFELVLFQEKECILSQRINQSMNPYLNTIENSFIWTWIEDNKPTVSFSIRFDPIDFKGEVKSDFSSIFFRCMYEGMQKSPLENLVSEDAEYLADLMQDVDMHENEEYENSEQSESEELESSTAMVSDGDSGAKNSLMAVGYKNNRSFVVRGNKLGVFKQDDENNLEFITSVDTSTKSNEKFQARKLLLHNQDSSMLMLKPGDHQNVYRMDLEYGKVVEEWHVDDNIKVDDIVQSTKYGQQSVNNTLVGLNNKSIFSIDSRLPDSKIAAKKVYSKRNLAIGSTTGDIRLYNQIGKRACTHLPGLGDPIIGLDTTESGKYILATCETYLMVIDTQPESNGPTSFQKSVKSKPIRLALKPQHIAWMDTPVCFTPAHFNTGTAEEKLIVTSTGPYIITWNFRQVKNGHEYQIKECTENVVADNFRFGVDRNIIVTLGSHVELAQRNQLKSPASLLTPSKSKTVREFR